MENHFCLRFPHIAESIFLNLDNESVVKCRHMKRANTNQLTVKEFWESRLISKIGHGMVSKLFVQIQ